MWTKTYKVVGFLEPGVVKFGDKNLMIYISKEAIERYSHRLKGKPVTIGHIEGITEENAQKVSVGDVAVCTEPGECIVTIKNEEADRLIENGERFSCCWVPVRWGEGGTWHNIPYDKELVEMDFTHLAIVPDPRYENVEVFMNSKEHNNATLRPRSDDAGPGFSRAAADSQTKVARMAQPTTYNVSTFTEQPKQHKGVGDRKIVKVSSFQNSLNPKQYAFLKKYIKEWNNEADAPDNSSERMDRINKYLQKREDRRADQYYKTHEEPKQYAPKVSEHFGGYKNCSYRRKDGKEWNNECVKKYLKEYKNAQYKVNPTDRVTIDSDNTMHLHPSSADKVRHAAVFKSVGITKNRSLEGRALKANV